MNKLMTALLGASLLSTPVYAQSAWTGSDDQPNSPLACTGESAAPEPGEYNGGTPTNAPDRKGKDITVVDIPKLVGVGYFASTAEGMQEAAKELGNITINTDGPTRANIDEQITFKNFEMHHFQISGQWKPSWDDHEQELEGAEGCVRIIVLYY